MHYEFNQGDKTDSNKKRDCDTLNATFLQQVNNKEPRTWMQFCYICLVQN